MQTCRNIGLFALGFILVLVGATRVPEAQQHSYTPQEIEEGRKLYDANCGRCHNDDGAGVPGTEIFKQIRRAISDEEIANLIITGIPASGMPPHTFSNPQAMSVVAFLRTAANGAPAAAAPAATAAGGTRPTAGDAARGKALAEGRAGCLGCHKIAGAGGTSGPDLSTIGAPPRGGRGPAAAPSAATLERALLDPDVDVAPAFRVFQVVTTGGQTVRGTLLNQDTFSIQMRDQSGELRAFVKSGLKSSGFEPSPMPSYRTRLNAQELSDVVSYLLSLKG
jgi:cytochrome c oxidase cbb3-type subunit 3